MGRSKPRIFTIIEALLAKPDQQMTVADVARSVKQRTGEAITKRAVHEGVRRVRQEYGSESIITRSVDGRKKTYQQGFFRNNKEEQ